MRDIIVIFQLVGDFGNACAGDRAHVVVPPVDPLARFAVVGRPAEIGGVDVSGHAFLEAVQLVRADKVHLAGQRCLIASTTQVMRVGRDIRGKLGRVVIDAGTENLRVFAVKSLALI